MCPDGAPAPIFRSHPSTPQLVYLGQFWPVFSARKSQNSGQKSPSPAALTGGRSGQFGTLMGATGGTQTHSRRTGSKLGQLHRARQGLVRVPESNTKYGGKGRKTGVAPRLLCRQVSVSPQGFPSKKNCFEASDFGFAPLFTGQLFIVRLPSFGACSWETHVRLRRCPGWHGRRPVVSGFRTRQGATDSHIAVVQKSPS